MCPWQEWLNKTTVYHKLSGSHSLSTRVLLTIWCMYSHRQALLQQMVSSTATATAADSTCLLLIKTDGAAATATATESVHVLLVRAHGATVTVATSADSAYLLLIRVHGIAAMASEALGMLMEALRMLIEALWVLMEAAPAGKCCLMLSRI